MCGRIRKVGTIRGWGLPRDVEPINSHNSPPPEGTVRGRSKNSHFHSVSTSSCQELTSLVKPAPSIPGSTPLLRSQVTRMVFNLLNPTFLLPYRIISFPFDMEIIRQVQATNATLRQSKPRLKLRARRLVSLVLPST